MNASRINEDGCCWYFGNGRRFTSSFFDNHIV